jgi:hypothetical protein
MLARYRGEPKLVPAGARPRCAMRVEATGQKSRTTYKYFPRGWTVRGSVEFLLNGDTQRRGVRYTMTKTSVAVPHKETTTGVPAVKSTKKRSQRRRNHWILLDSAWAKLLGVRKTAGVYQIRSNELQFKLFLMQEAPGSSAPTPTGPLTREEIVLIHNLEVLAAQDPGKAHAATPGLQRSDTNREAYSQAS